MRVVKPGYMILRMSGEGLKELRALEQIGRVCYQSEPKAKNKDEAEDITYNFIERLIKNGHEAMLEHGGMTVLFTCDRGVSHELVRHRMASFAQESTRWCNYSKDKFGGELTFVLPHYLRGGDDSIEPEDYWWESAMDQAEESYIKMTGGYFRANPDWVENNVKTMDDELHTDPTNVCYVHRMLELFQQPEADVGNLYWDLYEMLRNGENHLRADIRTCKWIEYNGEPEVVSVVDITPWPTGF